MTQTAWIPGTQWKYMQTSIHNTEHMLLYAMYCSSRGEVGMIASAWMNPAEFTEEMFERCSSLAWLRWDRRSCQLEKEVHVKARKRWTEVDGCETHLESNNTSRIMTPHGLRIMGTIHHHQDAGESGVMPWHHSQQSLIIHFLFWYHLLYNIVVTFSLSYFKNCNTFIAQKSNYILL